MSNEQILRQFMQQVWNEKDIAAIPQFVHPAYTIHIDTGDPWEGKTLDHREFEIRLHYSFDSFPDIHFAIQQAVSDGDYVAITWIMTGTNLGKLGDIPPTNKPIHSTGVTLYHFNNGKVCGHSQVFDRTTIMRQLGFI
jgi:predicted ester cyclase